MKRILLIILILVFAFSLLGFLWLRKTVTIVVDGQPQSRTTYALKVQGALSGIDLHARDVVEPPLDAWVSDGDTITVEHAAPVQILADGQLHNLVSAARHPQALLAEAGLSIGEYDQLLSNGQPITVDQPLPYDHTRSLQVIRPVTINLQNGLETPLTQTITSTTGSVIQVLSDAGIQLRSADHLTYTHSTPNQIEAFWIPSQPIFIRTANGTISYRSSAETIGEALAEVGLPLQGLDYSEPHAASRLPADGQISLHRVREEVLLEQELLPFEAEISLVDDLELDQRKLVQSGQYGIQAERVRVRYQDDEEISRVSESQWVAQPPLPEIVGYGTKIVQKTLETPNGTITYYRALQFYATAYSPKSQGGSFSTATGEILRKGIVAIDPDYVPYGTLLYIPGYGIGKAADTGHIIGRWIDLGYSDDDKESWSRWTTVYFLWPPPAYVPPFIPPPSYY